MILVQNLEFADQGIMHQATEESLKVAQCPYLQKFVTQFIVSIVLSVRFSILLLKDVLTAVMITNILGWMIHSYKLSTPIQT
jgi:hypothetical protein